MHCLNLIYFYDFVSVSFFPFHIFFFFIYLYISEISLIIKNPFLFEKISLSSCEKYIWHYDNILFRHIWMMKSNEDGRWDGSLLYHINEFSVCVCVFVAVVLCFVIYNNFLPHLLLIYNGDQYKTGWSKLEQLKCLVYSFPEVSLFFPHKYFLFIKLWKKNRNHYYLLWKEKKS